MPYSGGVSLTNHMRCEMEYKNNPVSMYINLTPEQTLELARILTASAHDVIEARKFLPDAYAYETVGKILGRNANARIRIGAEA